MSIHQFFSNNGADNNYFHSSSYGKIAHGDRIGSLGQRTFGERYSVERNRKVIQRYHSSHIAQRSIRSNDPDMPASVERSRGNVEMPTSRQGQSLGVPHRPIVPPTRSAGFHEPPTRGYNPFS